MEIFIKYNCLVKVFGELDFILVIFESKNEEVQEKFRKLEV